MSEVTQVAFQLPTSALAEIDRAVPERFPSRAAALRKAVSDLVWQLEQERIDAALEAGYSAVPQGAEERGWAEVAVEGLGKGSLD